MKKSNKGKRWIIPFAIINVFLIENMAKAYEFSWVSDPIRLLCYAGLLCFGLIFSILHLIKKRGLVERRSIGLATSIYLIIILIMLLGHNNTASDIFLVCFMIPLSILTSYYGYMGINNIDISIDIESGIFVILWIAFIYNKLFLHQAGAGKLNSIFYLILLLPFILCIKHKLWRRCLILLLIIAAVISLKRTALLILFLGLIVYLWNRNTTDKSRMIKMFGAIIGLFIVVIIVQEKFSVDILGKFEAMSEDGGSGRADIYKVLLENLFSRSLSSFLFGDGYYAVVNLVGGTAHNDFLEIFFDFGLIGFCAYLNIYRILIKNYIQMKKIQYLHANQFLVSIICFFVMSMLSHVIMIPSYMMFICLFWGMILSDYKKTISISKEKLKYENCNIDIS